MVARLARRIGLRPNCRNHFAAPVSRRPTAVWTCGSWANRAARSRWGPADIELSGTSQVTGLHIRDCRKLAFTAHAPVAPFAQLRPAVASQVADTPPRVAGLGFDGGNDGRLAVVNLWYRNPHQLPITSGTEFRLYRAGSSGIVPRESDPRESVAWWSAPPHPGPRFAAGPY